MVEEEKDNVQYFPNVRFFRGFQKSNVYEIPFRKHCALRRKKAGRATWEGGL